MTTVSHNDTDEECRGEEEQLFFNHSREEKWRNLVAFWFLGLTNNYAYVIMLSAAHDILSKDFDGNNTFDASLTNSTDNGRDCNNLSTGTILLADIIPALIVKLLAPFIFGFIHIRVLLVVLLGSLSFLLVGFASSAALAIIGVTAASASSGLGESTYLGYSSFFHPNVISTFASGTGASGLLGALSYAGLILAGFSPKETVLIMLIVPVIMALSFWVVLEHSPSESSHPQTRFSLNGQGYRLLNTDAQSEVQNMNLKMKFQIIPSLINFMWPLVSVYVAEYLINQGLSELIYFPNEHSWLTHAAQYRWYQVLYQVGVLISRSSVNLIHIRRVWITAVFQWINVILFLTTAIYWWIGSIWIIFILIFWEGLLGGAAYVNTFYKVSLEVPSDKKEFALQVISVSDTFGVTLSGFIAIPLHNAICALPL